MSRSVVIPVALRAIASCSLVAIWLIYFFLQPLKQDAIIMVRTYVQHNLPACLLKRKPLETITGTYISRTIFLALSNSMNSNWIQ
jgi:hypothetical protein